MADKHATNEIVFVYLILRIRSKKVLWDVCILENEQKICATVEYVT